MITKKQKEVYDYISDYALKNGYAPTQKEIKEHFGLKSFGSVQRYIKYLTNAGYLECDWNARRGLKATTTTSSIERTDSYMFEIPLFGDIAAGDPIEAIENPTETIHVPQHMVVAPGKYFALTIRGESMIEDGILENDIIVCKYIQDANQGQTVVALIDGEATVKHYYKYSDRIELHPANSSMQPIKLYEGDFKIAGTPVGLIRSYL